jgi:transposase-like protein
MTELLPMRTRGSLLITYTIWYVHWSYTVDQPVVELMSSARYDLGQLAASIALKVLEDKSPHNYLNLIYTEWAMIVSTSGCEKYGKVVTSCQHLFNLLLFSSSFCSFYASHIANMSLQLTPTKRQRIAFRYTETRDSRNPPTMVQIGKEFGVATSTVSKTLRRWREHGTTYTLDRSGRPSKMSPRDKRRAVAYMKSHPRSTWAEIADKFGVGVTKIRAVAHDAGLHKRVVRRTPFVSPQARK